MLVDGAWPTRSEQCQCGREIRMYSNTSVRFSRNANGRVAPACCHQRCPSKKSPSSHCAYPYYSSYSRIDTETTHYPVKKFPRIGYLFDQVRRTAAILDLM